MHPRWWGGKVVVGLCLQFQLVELVLAVAVANRLPQVGISSIANSPSSEVSE